MTAIEIIRKALGVTINVGSAGANNLAAKAIQQHLLVLQLGLRWMEEELRRFLLAHPHRRGKVEVDFHIPREGEAKRATRVDVTIGLAIYGLQDSEAKRARQENVYRLQLDGPVYLLPPADWQYGVCECGYGGDAIAWLTWKEAQEAAAKMRSALEEIGL